MAFLQLCDYTADLQYHIDESDYRFHGCTFDDSN